MNQHQSTDASGRCRGPSWRLIKSAVDRDAEEAMKILLGGEFRLTPSERARLLAK